ncbi:class I adenylate-forming enzyme family protein [Streptomyces albipurpureus]|uniref:AMP-binding protein n=1 Tax=Streptomyces albipurpureus TaxID=2897419 RepID=A0ABT0UTF9_9ACTN|nr:AMP-binding protein [Streptomyces sp. CWNU-1]MCM2391882.1 AMP-binding protein [Streptomyces sp. CWNU-1]
MNIAHWLAATALRTPAAPALLTGDRIVSDYASFAASSASVGAWLRTEHGVAPGDRVALHLTNSARYLQCLYGIWWCGAVAVPINRKLTAGETAAVVEDAGATVVFTDSDATDGSATGTPDIETTASDVGRATVVPVADAPWRDVPGPREPVERGPDDLAWLFYTSGTTGRPKGVMLTQGNLLAMALCQVADVDPVGPGEAVLYAAPLSHGAGLSGLIHVRAGSRHVFPATGRFNADEVLTLAEKLGQMSLFAAPTMVRRLVTAARGRRTDGRGIKTVIYGGGPMYLADLHDAISVLGHRFVQIYGQGESPMTITKLSRADHQNTEHPRYEQRLAGVGTAHSAVRVRVSGPDGQALPPGRTGEIEVKGATVMAGYWRDPGATAAALHDGWLRTGDLGVLDEDGYLTLAGRSKELIVSGGSNIHPREVEEALVTHPGVAEAAVVGVPDPEWGELVVAFVVPAGGDHADPAALDAHCRGLIANFKRPRRYHLVPKLPRNAYGKVDKSALHPILATP